MRILVFPPGGWWRTATYLRKRIARLPGTPRAIACGAAWGVTIAVSPFWGLHVWLSLGLTWLTRGSLIAAAIGTTLGNPWTFPLIVALTYQVGLWFLPSAMQPPAIDLGDPRQALAILLDHPGELLLPMVVGWVPVGLLSWVMTFWLVRRAVAEYHRCRRERRHGASSAVAAPDPAVVE